MAEQRGRPLSASQRPTGGDKAIAGEEAVLPAQEGVPFLRREDRRHRLQGREAAERLHFGARARSRRAASPASARPTSGG